MKRLILVFAIAGVALFSMQSCKKEKARKPPIIETINVNLKVNESYIFTVPSNSAHEPYHITTQTLHYSISEIGKDASGNAMYQYIPVLNYSGNDQVTMTNGKEEEECEHPTCNGPHHPRPQGECDKNRGEHYIININFTIANESSRSR